MKVSRTVTKKSRVYRWKIQGSMVSVREDLKGWVDQPESVGRCEKAMRPASQEIGTNPVPVQS
jgi:hypothetical protein